MYHFDLETKARFDANAKLIVREPHMLLKFVRAFIPGLDDYSDDELLDILSDAKVLNNEIYDGYKNYMTDVVLLVETQNPFILHYEIQSYFRPKEFEKRFEAYGNGVEHNIQSTLGYGIPIYSIWIVLFSPHYLQGHYTGNINCLNTNLKTGEVFDHLPMLFRKHLIIGLYDVRDSDRLEDILNWQDDVGFMYNIIFTDYLSFDEKKSMMKLVGIPSIFDDLEKGSSICQKI